MPTDTSTYAFNHICLRIKSIDASLKFYTEVLGMKYITRRDIPSLKVTAVFVAFVDSVPEDEQEKLKLAFSHPGVVELFYVWGSDQKEGKIYSSGNEEVGLGYGHICILVDSVHEACERFKSLGVNFTKTLEDGDINTVAYITDPDGYWIEAVDNPKITGKTPI